MEQEELNLIVAANERYMPGALVALASVAVNACPETRLRCHVFTEDVKAQTFEFLERTLKRLHTRIVIVQHACDESLLKGLPKWAGSRLSAVRIFYPKLLPDIEWALYLDCDILYLASVEKHFATRDSSVYACVAREMSRTTPTEESQWAEKHGIELDVKNYFNAGVMLLNLKKWREDGVCEKLNMFFRDHNDILYPDQTAMNVVFGSSGKKVISQRYNWLQGLLDDAALAKRPVIHYVSGVPWSAKISVVANGRFDLWHAFADKFVWQKDGESLRRNIPQMVLLGKRMEFYVLKNKFLCTIFFVVLRFLGKGKYLRGWKNTAINFDVSKEGIVHLLNETGKIQSHQVGVRGFV